MKKIWIYLLGVLTGIVTTLVVLFIIAYIINANNSHKTSYDLPGATFFEQPGEVINESSFKVFQSLVNGAALAKGKEDGLGLDLYMGLNVLIYNDEEIPYYDEQIIDLPDGKCFRQIGIYKYESRQGLRTVPIVTITDR